MEDHQRRPHKSDYSGHCGGTGMVSSGYWTTGNSVKDGRLSGGYCDTYGIDCTWSKHRAGKSICQIAPGIIGLLLKTGCLLRDFLAHSNAIRISKRSVDCDSGDVGISHYRKLLYYGKKYGARGNIKQYNGYDHHPMQCVYTDRLVICVESDGDDIERISFQKHDEDTSISEP